MATQTLEFDATPGLTISCKLFALGSDTVTATASATEKTNDKGRYSVAYTDIAAGEYRLNGFVSGVGGFANEVYDLTLTTATFYPRSEATSEAATAAQHFPPVVRGTADTKPIGFAWVATGATITGTVSIDFATPVAIQGTFTETDISFTGTDGVTYYVYTLSYDADDRPTSEGTAIYELSDDAGPANVGVFTLRVDDIASALTIVPAAAAIVSRVQGVNITLYTAETATVAVSVTDEDGAAVDLTGLTLELIFESGSSETVISNAAITKANGSFSFAATSTLTAAERVWKWALRKTADEAVICSGTLEVIYAANQTP